MQYKSMKDISPKWILLRIVRAIGIFILFVVGAGIYLTQPTCSRSEPSSRTVNLERMQNVVKTLSVDFHPRSYQNRPNLNRTAATIFQHFEQAGGSPEYQPFETSCGPYKNVRCVFRKGSGPRIIVGAHYDSYAETPGADDNASGIAGLIELAYLLGEDESIGNIELVAYSLEEPPFFRTEEMGSFFHAQSLAQRAIDVQGVIILEMIGYYSESKGSQGAPMPLLKLVYPNRGNYILVAGHTGQRKFTQQIKSSMKGATDLGVYSISAPKKLPGMDFSDHLNYWRHDFNAVMITDTAFFRNKEYHSANDTYDRLNYKSMGDTVLGVYNALKEMRK